MTRRNEALGVFAVLFVVYWACRSGSFGAGDSPQHVLSALTFGVSWPPGYPLYNLLGFLLSRLPFGSPEGIVNGFSGLCHAATCAVLFLFLGRRGLGLWPALAAVGFMAFSPLFWYYSEVAEVRALNDLLAMSAAFAAFEWSETKSRRWLIALAALLGLGISHHPTYVLILPALAVLLWSSRSLPKKSDAIRSAAVLFGACAAPYLILGLRLKLSAPVYNPMGVASWQGVLDLFMRKNLGGPLRMVGGRGFFDLGGFRLEPLVAQAGWLAHSAWAEPGLAGAFLALAGVWRLWNHGRKELAFWSVWICVSLAAFLFISSQQLHLHDPEYARAIAVRFYLMPFLGLFALSGHGAQEYADRAKGKGMGWSVPIVVAGIFFSSAALNMTNLRGRDPLLGYGRDILNSSVDGAVVILAADDTVLVENYLDYIKHETGRRIFLNPVLFTSPFYRRELASRYPDLVLPPFDRAGFTMDWHEWMRLNPKRQFYSEVMFLQILQRSIKPLRPCGVLIAMNDKPRGCADILSPNYYSLPALKMSDLHPFTQEIYLARAASLILAWSASLTPPTKGNEAYLGEIEARLNALQ